MPSSSSRLVVLLLLVALPVHAAPAAGDFERYMNAATKLYDDLEYELALEQLVRAKKVARGPDEDATVALYEGLISADRSKWEKARALFRTALLLNKDVTLPPGVPPKVKLEFEKLRAQVEGNPTKPPEPAPTPPQPPPEARASDTPTQPSVQPPPPPEPSPVPVVPIEVVKPTRPVLIVPFIFVGAGILAAGTGTWLGLSSRGQVTAARQAQFQSDVISHQVEAQRSASAANILWGTAGLAAVGALVSWWLTPHAPPPSPQESP